MSFDFPNTPNVGDLFQDSTSGAVYRWNGYAWVGGVTGIGLQTLKETRYLVAGAFTHTRDPKCNGTADIFLLGAMGLRIATPVWASGQVVGAGSGSAGTIGIKWKYALPPTAPVVVGASAAVSGPSGASSFDTGLTAPGGLPGTAFTTVSTGNNTANGGGVPGPATGCDESYPGQSGVAIVLISGAASPGMGVKTFLRGVCRTAANCAASGVATLPAAPGDPGAVVVVEYLNP